MNTSNNEGYDILIGADSDWTVSVDDESVADDFEFNCSCGSQDSHEDGF